MADTLTILTEPSGKSLGKAFRGAALESEPYFAGTKFSALDYPLGSLPPPLYLELSKFCF
jgi:hypothetical protein